jgi:hypothetical protein
VFSFTTFNAKLLTSSDYTYTLLLILSYDTYTFSQIQDFTFFTPLCHTQGRRARERESKRARERERACVCVCVCEWKRAAGTSVVSHLKGLEAESHIVALRHGDPPHTFLGGPVVVRIVRRLDLPRVLRYLPSTDRCREGERHPRFYITYRDPAQPPSKFHRCTLRYLRSHLVTRHLCLSKLSSHSMSETEVNN